MGSAESNNLKKLWLAWYFTLSLKASTSEPLCSASSATARGSKGTNEQSQLPVPPPLAPS